MILTAISSSCFLLFQCIILSSCSLGMINSPSYEMNLEKAKKIIKSYELNKYPGITVRQDDIIVANTYFTDVYLTDISYEINNISNTLYPNAIRTDIEYTETRKYNLRKYDYSELGQMKVIYSMKNILSPFTLFIIGPVIIEYKDETETVNIKNRYSIWSFFPFWLTFKALRTKDGNETAQAFEYLRLKSISNNK